MTYRIQTSNGGRLFVTQVAAATAADAAWSFRQWLTPDGPRYVRLVGPDGTVHATADKRKAPL